MTCSHEIYSRYIRSERDAVGVEWCVAGCKFCDATMRFPAQAHLAREYSAMKRDYERGMTVRLVAAKYGQKSPGRVVTILQSLGTKMRPAGSPKGAPGKKATATARKKMSDARRAWHAKRKRGPGHDDVPRR